MRLEQKILDSIQRDLDIDQMEEETPRLPEVNRRSVELASPTQRPVGPSDSFLDLVEHSPGKQSSTFQMGVQKSSRQNMQVSKDNILSKRTSPAKSGQVRASLVMLEDPKDTSLHSADIHFEASDHLSSRLPRMDSAEYNQPPSTTTTEGCFKVTRLLECLVRRKAYTPSFQQLKLVSARRIVAQATKESAISIQEGHFPIHLSGAAPMMEVFKVAADSRQFGRTHDPRTESLRSGTASSPMMEKRSIIASFSDRETQNSLHKYLPYSPKEVPIPTLAFNHDKEPPVTDPRGFLNGRNLHSPTSATDSLTSRPGFTRFGVLTEGTTKSSRIHFGVMSPQELYIPQGFNKELKDTEAWRRFNQTALYYDQLSRRLDDSLRSADKTKFSRGVLGASRLAETPKSDLKGLLDRLQERNQQLSQTSVAAFGGVGTTRRFLTPQKLELQSNQDTTREDRTTPPSQQLVKSPKIKSKPLLDHKTLLNSAERGLRDSHSVKKVPKDGQFGKSRRKSKTKQNKDDVGFFGGTWAAVPTPTKDIMCRVPFTSKPQSMSPRWVQKGAGAKIKLPTRS